MARPRCCRHVDELPAVRHFKPQGIPLHRVPEVLLAVEELEAIRLADLEGLYQEEAAARMNVSRATFGRIIESARRKVAEAIVTGKALRIEGGDFEMPNMRTFVCTDCQHSWQSPCGTGRPSECPSCHKQNFHRADGEGGGQCGHGHGHAHGHGHGQHQHGSCCGRR